MSERAIRCRYIDQLDNRCTSEALDPDAVLVLCVAHTASAILLIRDLVDRAPALLISKENS